MLPLYEAKMLHLYDTRWATYEADGSTRPMTEAEKAERLNPMPRYWVHESDVDRKLEGRWDKSWFLGWRDICRSTDERTAIATLLPRVAVGNKVPVAMPKVTLERASLLQAALASFALDFAARQKMGSVTMNFFIFMQLPVPTPSQFDNLQSLLGLPTQGWISSRVDRLNAWIADPIERARVRAELDALMFHVYGLDSSEVSHVLDSFPIVQRKDEGAFGSYRTKELILDAFAAMQESKQSDRPYESPWRQESIR